MKNCLRLVMKKERKWNYIILAIVVLVYAIILSLRYDFLYYNNDDPAMEEILSGLCTGTPDGHTWFHMYPLSWVLSKLYCILPDFHWYGCFLWLCQMGCVYACIVRTTEIIVCPKKQYMYMILTFLLMAGVMLPENVILTFTAVSGMLGATAVFLTATTNFVNSKGNVIFKSVPAMICYYFAFCIRKDMALLLLPFLLCAGVFFVMTYKREQEDNLVIQKRVLFGFVGLFVFGTISVITRWDAIIYITIFWGTIIIIYCLGMELKRLKKQIWGFVSLFVILFTVCGLTYVIHMHTYDSEEWKYYKEYVETRSAIYDYGTIPTYDESIGYYTEIGLSEADVATLRTWNFMLSEKYNLSVMKDIRDYKEQFVSYRYSIYYIKVIMLDVVTRLMEFTDAPYMYVFIILIMICAACIVINKQYSKLVLLILIMISHMVCWGYLLWQGRILERVTHGLYLTEFLLLLGIIFVELQNFRLKKLDVVMYIVIFSVILYATINKVQFFESDIALPGNYADKSAQYELWKDTLDYCNQDLEQIYILDTYTYSVYVTQVFGQEQITSANCDGIGNVVLAGHWVAESPLWYEKINKLCGADTLQEAHNKGEDLCFIINPIWITDELSRYLQENYPNMEIIYTDSL